MTNKKTNKSSAKRKLVPAIGMLTVSAMMLSSATYAWFTMSREVEVTGIKMTATTPEDIQISLGDNTGIVKTEAANVGTFLSTADGVTPDTAKIIYSDIKAPDGATNGNDETSLVKNTTDWYNTVDFSEHYVAGKLKPVSSTDGNYLFKTLDATLVGKTVDRTATFSSAEIDDRAGLYRIGSLANNQETKNVGGTDKQLNYTLGTNDLVEGYYIDFPVWFRTSATANTSVNGTGGYLTTESGTTYLNLGVQASITQRTATDTDEDLYHAVRVAVLESGTDATSATPAMVHTGADGVITNLIQGTQDSLVGYYDRYASTKGGTHTNTTDDTLTANENLDTVTNQALFKAGSLIWNPSTAKVTNADSLYGATDFVNQATTTDDGMYTNGESVVKIPVANGTNAYGYSERYVIRVWIEGEDVNCWNETAGQDFDIALKFVQLKSMDDATAHNGVTTGVKASVSGTADQATVPDTITVKLNNANKTFEYNKTNGKYAVNATTTWKSDDTVGNAIDKAVWKLADGTSFANENDFVNYLNQYAGKYDFSGTVTLTSDNYQAPTP